MIKWGFTGSQAGTDEDMVLETLFSLPLQDEDWVITGACIGIDSQVFHLVKDYYPRVHQLVVFPADMSRVDHSIEQYISEAVYMPQGTDYRDRNERLVAESERMVAFWKGSKRSGTYMTMNIARKVSKLHKIVHID